VRVLKVSNRLIFLDSKDLEQEFRMSRRQARHPNRRPRYPTDLNDGRWHKIQALIPAPGVVGRPRQVSMRRVFDAVLYVTRAGCAWRLLPKDNIPPWETLYAYFRRWSRTGV
jgi:hypothetical protein